MTCTLCGCRRVAAIVRVRDCRSCDGECKGHRVCAACSDAARRRPDVTSLGLT